MPDRTEPDGPVRALLDRHGLVGAAWRPLPHDGYSGAALFACRDGAGRDWVLKRTSLSEDWIMRATADVHGRESRFADTPLLVDEVRSAAVGGARVGAHCYTLMVDISAYMFSNRLDGPMVSAVVAGMARLHRAQFGTADEPWCALEDRLLLLTSGVRALPASRDRHGLRATVRAGWDEFNVRAPRRVRELLRAVHSDVGLLVGGLRGLPITSLHGDLKLDNLGIDPAGAMWLIDWALAVRAPACVELGWFIAVNADRLRVSPQRVVDLYADAAGLDSAQRHRHDALTGLCGLVLRGWRKALDVDRSSAGAAEFGWWCELAADAERYLG